MQFIIHNAIKGETWDSVAFAYYFDEQKMKLLLDCNAEYCDCLVFEGGERLNIPVITEDEMRATTAPWKR